MTSRGVSMDKPIGEGGATVATVVPSTALRQDARMERTQNTEAIASALKSFMEPLNARQRAIFAGRIMHDIAGKDQACAKSFSAPSSRTTSPAPSARMASLRCSARPSKISERGERKC